MSDSGRERGARQGGGQGRPAQGSGRPERSGRRGQPTGRSGTSGRGGSGAAPGGQGRPQKERYAGVSSRREDREPRSTDQALYDGPPLPEEVTGKELDRNVLAQLRGLPEKLAARIARHLVAAGQLLDTDPETAYQHTLAARARASRVAVVREATGEAAYAAGHFAEALAELRAAKRMNGAIDYLPVMADCERALGRPERALALAKNPSVAKLPMDQQIEMTIVEAGARYDLGEVDSALRTLENAPVRSVAREDWVVRLRYAYADLLLKAGRREDAVVWFHRTAGIDGGAITDAAERILELEGVVLEDTEDTDASDDRAEGRGPSED
jgi:tetratricopeptide (TPR) repeat protein